MNVKKFMVGAIESNVFIAWCERTSDAIMVDCGEFQDDMAAFVDRENLKLKTIFITHGHYDHTDGLPEAVKRFKPRVLAAGSNPGGCRAERVKHGDVVTVGGFSGTVVETPGHTPDGISLIFEGDVFTGDALFAGSVGGTSSPELAAQQVDAIRKHIFTLPGAYRVHVGHGPSTTVEIERTYNPFFV